MIRGTDRNIPLSKLHPFKDHPYKVEDKVEMDALCESIGKSGLLSPSIVRPRDEGGYEITYPAEVEDNLYFAGAKIKDGKLVNSGGRVLGVTAVADDLKGAVAAAYEKAGQVHFANAYCRKDIGAKALAALK